jgi:hypothetical protein
MNKLEQLKSEAWSYAVGWNTSYKAYLCRVWKDRPKPAKIKTIGGKDTISFMWMYGGLGYNLDAAIEECLKNKELKVECERTA